jgi:hypothetical protein
MRDSTDPSAAAKSKSPGPKKIMFITEADSKVRAIHAKSDHPAALAAHRQEIFSQEVQG